eukprot:2682548-Amphidinium_carterae.1
MPASRAKLKAFELPVFELQTIPTRKRDCPSTSADDQTELHPENTEFHTPYAPSSPLASLEAVLVA